MPFSFNPTQPTVAGGQSQVPVPGSIEPVKVGTSGSAPSLPDTPFLFIRYRDQGMTVNAYLQIMLMMVSAFAILATVVVFAYSQYLTSSINSQKQKLLAADSDIKADYHFDDMKRLSKRFASLGVILKNYVSVRTPLKLLEDVVEKQVVFDKFNFNKNFNDQGYTMAFTVVTNNYPALIQQLEALNLDQYSKIVPKDQKKIGSLTGADTNSLLKVQVVAPVFAAGVLPDDVVFVPSSGSSTPAATPDNTTSGGATP